MADRTKQYVYMMAVLAGGGVIIAPHYGPEPLATFALYGLLSFIFGFIWPRESWHWGLIIAFSDLVLIGLNVVNAGTPMALTGYAPMIAGVLGTGCSASFLGARWSFRAENIPNPYAWQETRSTTQQYVHVMAILAGGIIILTQQFGPDVVRSFLMYSLLAAFFGFFWPRDGWQWGLWISLPLLMLSGYKMVLAKSVGVFINDSHLLAQVVASAFVGAFSGAKLSIRKTEEDTSHFYFRYYDRPSQYLAPALAMLVGGAALLAPNLGLGIWSTLAIYGLSAFIFGLFWPKEGWHWGLWFCVPLLVLSIYKAGMMMGNLGISGAIIPDINMFAQALAFAAAGAFLGSRFSFRRKKKEVPPPPPAPELSVEHGSILGLSEPVSWTPLLRAQKDNPVLEQPVPAAIEQPALDAQVQPAVESEPIILETEPLTLDAEPLDLEIERPYHERSRDLLMDIRQQVSEMIREKEREVHEHEIKVREAIAYISALNDVLATIDLHEEAAPAGQEMQPKLSKDEMGRGEAEIMSIPN